MESFLDKASFCKQRITSVPLDATQQYHLEVIVCQAIIDFVQSVIIGNAYPVRQFRQEDCIPLESDLEILEQFVKTWPNHPLENVANADVKLIACHEDAIIKVVKLRENFTTYFLLDQKSLKELQEADDQNQTIEGVLLHRFGKK
eukprot:NODE_23_length_42016_cov_0.755803.p27 type:complete len:145 gc:universal NODE_23_length_42016_cov_0.755803:22041-21607(-)